MRSGLIGLAVSIACVGFALPAAALDESTLSGYDFEQVTVSTSVVTLTQAKARSNPPAKKVTCGVESAGVRFRLDGTDPTASVGYPLSSGDIITLMGSDIASFEAIRSGGSDATLSCVYFR